MQKRFDFHTWKKRILAGILWLVLLTGCASTPIWIGKTPDRKNTFQIRQNGPRQIVLRDEKVLGHYAGIAIPTFSISENGREWAYAARFDKQWHMIRTGHDLGAWDGIGSTHFSSTGKQLAFTAEHQGQWRVILNDNDAAKGIGVNHQGPWFDAILQGSLAFNPEGNHLAYTASVQNQRTVILDQQPGPLYDGIASLTFSAQGGHLAYAARKNQQGMVILDGKEGPAYDAISEILFNPAGDQLAYLARRKDFWHAIVEGFESQPYSGIRNLKFSPDGSRIVFIASLGNQEMLISNGIPDTSTFAYIRDSSLKFRTGYHLPLYIAYTHEHKFVLVENGVLGEAFDEMTDPSISDDGSHLGYSARNNNTWFIFADGKKIGEESWAGMPFFNQSGEVAYLARRKGKEAVIFSGKEYSFDLLLEGSFQFSKNGLHWGCIAGYRMDRSFYYVIDGVKYQTLDLQEIVSLNLQVPTLEQNKIIQGWVLAEIERRFPSYPSSR